MNKEDYFKKPKAEIVTDLKIMSLDKKIELVPYFLSDVRKSFNDLGTAILKEKLAYDNELNRTENMYSMEKSFYDEYSLIGGIDEVGRGPLAGPVVTACVILPRGEKILFLNDSKKINEKKRVLLYNEILEKAVSIGIGICSNEEIDEINILNATKLGMARAIENGKLKPNFLLIDALVLKDVAIPQKGVIKGDEKIASVAAASIVAKVVRDRMMVELSKEFTFYDFENNKGYGTKRHYEGLNSHGYCSIHRKTFIKDYL